MTERPRVDYEARRQEYEVAPLDVDGLAVDPLDQLERWLAEWAEIAPNEPYAMVLATADEAGRPSARNVLLRALDDRGATFFTSYESRKAHDLGGNPRATLLFSWVPVLRQVHLEGTVTKVPRADSEAYFAGRPRGSQLAAWASHQSAALADRAELEARFAAAEARFAGRDVPCPEHWGGYRVAPEVVEVWQGRPNRLHDRFRYQRDPGDEGWTIVRLSP